MEPQLVWWAILTAIFCPVLLAAAAAAVDCIAGVSAKLAVCVDAMSAAAAAAVAAVYQSCLLQQYVAVCVHAACLLLV